MLQYNSPAEKRTDPRPTYIPLGLDIERSLHISYTRSETVAAIGNTIVVSDESPKAHLTTTDTDSAADPQDWAAHHHLRNTEALQPTVTLSEAT